MVCPVTTPERNTAAPPSSEPISSLAAQIVAVHDGQGDPGRLMAGFRDTILLVPLGPRTTVLTSNSGGLRWILAFTSQSELARYSVARDEADQERRYITARGDRILDEFLPAVDPPCGVAIDIAGDRPMMLPPVRGIVADAIAVDRDSGR